MEQADLIWHERRACRLGGREGPRPDARAALRNRRVRQAMRCYDTELRPGDLPPRRASRPPAALGRAVLHADARTRPRSCARRRTSWSPRNEPALLLHPPDRHTAATARWASTRSTRRSRWRSRLWEWGAYLGDEGKTRRRAREGLLAGGGSARLADPPRQGLGSVPQQRAGQDRVDQGRLRRGDPAR